MHIDAKLADAQSQLSAAVQLQAGSHVSKDSIFLQQKSSKSVLFSTRWLGHCVGKRYYKSFLLLILFVCINYQKDRGVPMILTRGVKQGKWYMKKQNVKKPQALCSWTFMQSGRSHLFQSGTFLGGNTVRSNAIVATNRAPTQSIFQA